MRVNCDKIMHTRWDFDVSSARTQRVSALDKHQASACISFATILTIYPGSKFINLMLAWFNNMRCSHLRQHCERSSECNRTKIMHVHYFRVFWVSSIQISCSISVVNAECMNFVYFIEIVCLQVMSNFLLLLLFLISHQALY